MNIGGGAGSVGTPLVKHLFKAGLNKSTPSPEKLRDSVMSRFSRAGLPVIHMINISRLATRYGLPVEPEQRPEVEEGGIFAAMEYNIILTWGVLVGLIFSIFILLRMDFSHYFLRIRTNLKSNKLNSSPPPPEAK